MTTDEKATGEEVEAAFILIRRAVRHGSVAAEQVEQLLADFTNVGFGRDMEALANELGAEHPTLLGQIAKTAGLGVMRRTLGNGWNPGDPSWFEPGSSRHFEPAYLMRGLCTGAWGIHPRSGEAMVRTYPKHPEHDGRLECATVVGAELMAGQPLI